MQIYFYCSYAHSSRGFFMTRLDGAQLVPQDETQLPEDISDFFSYARYCFLWREYGEFVQPEPESGLTVEYTPGTAPDFEPEYNEARSTLRGLWSSARRMVSTSPAFHALLQPSGPQSSKPQQQPQQPQLVPKRPEPELKFERSGAFLGLRELHGTLADGRSATANLAILGDETEAVAIRRIALEILGDFDTFEKQLIGYLTVGGLCGYELDGEAFLVRLKSCSSHNALHKAAGCTAGAAGLLRHLTKKPESEPELIRLAACSYDWEQMRRYFGDGPQWEKQPQGVLSVPEFQELFCGHGALWTMDEEPMPAER